jgi:hypothetical protein
MAEKSLVKPKCPQLVRLKNEWNISSHDDIGIGEMTHWSCKCYIEGGDI